MKDILYRLFEHQYLGRDEARTILQNIAEGIKVFLVRIP